MRKILLFCVLFSGLKIISQDVNIANHLSIDGGLSIVSVNSKCFYLHTIKGCCGNGLSVVGINSNGQTIFEKNAGFGDSNQPVKLIKTNDHCTALVSWVNHCDTPTDQFSKNYFLKLDTNGTVVFQTAINNRYTVNNVQVLEKFKDFTQYADSSYYLVSDSLLYHYSKAGQFISKFNMGTTSIASITALNNGHLLFSVNINGVLKNIEMTTSNLIVSQQAAQNAIGKFIETNSGYLYGRTTAGLLEKYDQSLNFLLAAPVPAIRDFIMRHDSLFTTGSSTNPNYIFYNILNQNFSVLYQAQANYKGILPNSITINSQNKISIMSVGVSTGSLMSFTGFYQFPIGGNFVSKDDIGVINISVNTAYYKPTWGVPPPASGLTDFPADIIYDLDVTVKNFSSDTVKKFYLNKVLPLGNLFCMRFFHKLYNVTIPPNTSVVLQTGPINGEQVYLTTAEFEANATYTMKACLFTTTPDFSNDTDISNDQTCQVIQLVKGPTGIKSNNLSDTDIRVFPNPSNNSFHIQSDIKIKIIEIYNALGIMTQKILVNNNEWIIDKTDLSAGIYFIKLETEKGTLVKKVIKE